MGCLVRGGGEGEEGAGVDRTARIQAGQQFEWMGEWGRASRARVVAATEACKARTHAWAGRQGLQFLSAPRAGPGFLARAAP